MKKTFSGIAVFLLLLVMALSFGKTDVMAADGTATAITVKDIDYQKLTMKVYKNGNSIVFYSTDGKKTWNEVEGAVSSNSSGTYIEMDISWASPSSNVKIYFKGNRESTVINLTLPKQNAFKVKYDKAESDFIFTGNDDAAGFWWRKETDYNWHYVSFDTSDQSYIDFLNTVETLKFKGCKLIFRTGQVIGTDADNCGERPSREEKITIPKMAAAPSIKVNVKKMTINTKTTMEYYDEAKKEWVSCEKNMSVSEMAPSCFAKKNPKPAKLLIRVAASSSKPCSQIAIVLLPVQREAPAVTAPSGKGAAVYEVKSDNNVYLTFNGASKDCPIDYCVVKEGADFDPSTAKWKTVKNASKPVKITKKTCPSGSKIYFRYSGIAANASKNIELKFPSAETGVTITLNEEK